MTMTKIMLNIHILSKLEDVRWPYEDFDMLLTRLMDERFIERIGITLEDTTKMRLDSLGFDGLSYDDLILSLIPSSGSFVVGSSPHTPRLPFSPPPPPVPVGWIPPPPFDPEVP